MARIGEYRLKAYELLYASPVCEYTEKMSKKSSMNVLIVGNGWMGNEMFKAVFSAGQSVDTELNITVASQNAEEYGRELLRTGDGSSLPALKQYVEQKHYANLRFINIDVNEGVDEKGLIPLRFDKNHYNYVIVSLGDAERNWIAASEIASQISESVNNGLVYSGNIVIHVFNEFSAGISLEDQEALINYGKENQIEISFFGNELSETQTELDRIARNINFAYAMKYNQRANKVQTDEGFAKSLTKEFIESPMDYASGDISVIANFLGANYAADSSFAAAVHMPVKLAICKSVVPEKEPLDTLKEAIHKKNTLYKKLVALEHRRWNAYTIIRGFRAPTVQEENQILYHNGNTHQAKKDRLHICLSDCTESITLENDFDRVYKEWIDKKCPKDYPSELDRASLRVHQLTGKLAAKIDINEVLSMIKGENPEYSNLRRAILKLANDEDHSLVLYQRSLEEASAYAKRNSPNDEEIITKVDGTLMPFKVYNSRIDFFGLDQQLIEMLPFALWYGSKYKTVITVSDGSVTATHDVIVPTLFCAETAIFVGKTVGSTRYQKSIESYFESRGSNTSPQFLQLSVMSVETLNSTLEKLIDEIGAEGVVINCVPNRGVDAALAIGKLMEKYADELSVVQYVPNKGIVSYSSDKNIGVGVDNKSYSFSEFVQLMGGRVTNEFAMLYDSSQYDKLVTLFKDYCDSFKVITADNKAKNFNPWAVMTNLMASSAKDYVFESDHDLQTSSEILIYKGTFSYPLFISSKIGSTLRQLQEYRIIQNYAEKRVGNSVDVEFEYVNVELVELLQSFEEKYAETETVYKGLKFIPLNGGLKVTNRLVREIKLYNPLEPQEQIDAKISFMKDLLAGGYILDLTINKEGNMSFAFKDEATMHLLKTQGAVFELIVYHFMRESGLFDDCETGVKISWDLDEEQSEAVLLDILQNSLSDQIGYKKYMDERAKVLYGYKRKSQSVMNEVDVIGISGMEGVMVSCKTSDKESMQWIYEINSVSDRFQSCGVMAVSSDYSRASNSAFLERAKQMKVPVWGTETLWNPDKMRLALYDVVNRQ